jgi:hypothetical protein
MAKVTGPLMSLDASGTVGKTATFSKWKGQNYVRLRVTPLNPQSNAMQLVRIKMGAIGYGLSYVLSALTDEGSSALVIEARAKAPAGQSWISYLASQMAGAAFGQWNGVAEEYDILNATQKGYFGVTAAAMGLEDFTIAKPPTTPTSITGAEILYHIAQQAIVDLGYIGFTGGIAAATQQQVTDFAEYMTIED